MRAAAPHTLWFVLTLASVAFAAQSGTAEQGASSAPASAPMSAPASAPASAPTIPAKPVKPVPPVVTLLSPPAFGIFCGWLAACLYCATWSHRQSSIPADKRAAINWILLLTGPIGLLGLVIIQRNPKLKTQFEDLLGRILPRHSVAVSPVESLPITLCTSSGEPVGGIGGWRSHGKDALDVAKRVIYEALERRASDVLIDPRDGDVYLIRYRVDGILHEVARFPADQGVTVVNCFKVASGLDISEKRRPQDGAFLAKLSNREIKFPSATAGTLYGEKIPIRVFDVQAGLKKLDHLGLNAEERLQIVRFMGRSDGMLLVAGPTGSGKTTTIYAALNLLAGQGRNIVTIEDPIEYPLPHVSQTEVNVKAGMTFASGLRSILRQDPDVILVGEIRDAETAETALQASQTGHLVLSTIHSNDGLTALARLVEFGIEPFLITTGLAAVLSQRLVRVLCPKCKQPAEITPALRHGAAHRHIALGKVSVAVGCEECENSGYMGRTGIFEILPLSHEMGQLLTQRPSLATIKAQAVKEGVLTMRQRGMEKVLQGITTVEEVTRVTT